MRSIDRGGPEQPAGAGRGTPRGGSETERGRAYTYRATGYGATGLRGYRREGRGRHWDGTGREAAAQRGRGGRESAGRKRTPRRGRRGNHTLRRLCIHLHRLQAAGFQVRKRRRWQGAACVRERRGGGQHRLQR